MPGQLSPLSRNRPTPQPRRLQFIEWPRLICPDLQPRNEHFAPNFPRLSPFFTHTIRPSSLTRPSSVFTLAKTTQNGRQQAKSRRRHRRRPAAQEEKGMPNRAADPRTIHLTLQASIHAKSCCGVCEKQGSAMSVMSYPLTTYLSPFLHTHLHKFQTLHSTPYRFGMAMFTKQPITSLHTIPPSRNRPFPSPPQSTAHTHTYPPTPTHTSQVNPSQPPVLYFTRHANTNRSCSQTGNANKWKTPHQQSKLARVASGEGTIQPGDTGIWVTCARHQEGKAAREVGVLFAEVCLFLYIYLYFLFSLSDVFGGVEVCGYVVDVWGHGCDIVVFLGPHLYSSAWYEWLLTQ